MKQQNLFLFLLLFLGNMVLYAQCSVNAGGNTEICGTSYTLQGSSNGNTAGNPTWTLVSKPSGAPDPVISNVNSYTPNVTGMTSPRNYVFQIAQNCSPAGSVTSQVTITAPGDVSTFTAGPDITNVNATTGTVTLNGVVPAGYTASWSAYNIYSWERSSIKTSQNSQFSSTTSATTTFSLIKKADHDIDPAYVVTLRITSINNPNCWYEDTATVRFIPNPQILPQISTSTCLSSGGSPFIILQSTSPKFSQGYSFAPDSSGNFGTTITLNVTSQPAGGNITYSNIHDDRIYFTGVNVVGTYKFTLTITNSSGTYTTPEITYTYNGITPNPVNFLTSARPEQMMVYSSTGSGGEVQCGLAGKTTPITFYYTIDPADNPATITTNVTTSGILPPGGATSIVNGGAGTATRSATITPPVGGWRVGTYRFTVTRGNGTCSATQFYYIHISDGNRPDVSVPATTICYPGSGVVTATIPLPAVYKGVVNSSYFQDFNAVYQFTLVSKPAGASNPTYDPAASRTFTNNSTVISNLDKEGEYVFKIKAISLTGGVAAFLDKEYACSGTSLEGTFSVFVITQINSNAGSNQNVVGTTTSLNGNNPGVATGTWTLVSKPLGTADPVIVTPSAYNSIVTGLTSGTYTFRWTITTGTCTDSSDVNITVQSQNYCVAGCNTNTYLNATDPNTIEYDNLVAGDHAILAKEKDSTFKIWGQGTAPGGGPTDNFYVPTAITPANGFNYTGTPLKATSVGSGASTSSALLTTDGLYAWGTSHLISPSLKTTNSTTYAFGKVSVNGKADGLPPGVSPTDVKMMFGTWYSLVIVTCKGESWTLSGSTSNNAYGDGMSMTPANNLIWHRTKISATETLDNVVAVRGSYRAKFALTSEGRLFTWGEGTCIGDGTDNPTTGTARPFATEVVVPAGVTPKMIGMTDGANSYINSYFLLGTNGKLYSMGNNLAAGILGDGTQTNRNVWKEVVATSGSNTLGGNIVWISPSEHGDVTHQAINVLTSDKKQWGWGSNYSYKLGLNDQSGTTVYSTPVYMPGNSTNANGMALTDEIIAVETGGRFSVNYKTGSPYFGFVGKSEYGTIGNGTTGIGAYYQKYTYNTAIVNICIAASAFCYKPGITAGTALDTKVGITALSRAGATDKDNWPMVRKGGHIALESKTKAFVPNRVAFDGTGNPVGIPASDFVEGMTVYDTINKCLKMYTSKDNGTSYGWYCITTQTCPD